MAAHLTRRLLPFAKAFVKPTMPSQARKSVQCKAYSGEAYTGRYDFETLTVASPFDNVLHVELNRPESRNAMNKDLWREFQACFREIQYDTNCRAVVLSGSGKMFSAGLDLNDMQELTSQLSSDDDIARKAKFLYSIIAVYQESFNSIEKCNKPVIAAIHGGCIGAGVNMIVACDIRYASNDAWFTVKEVDLGMAADLGALQRMPKIVANDSMVRELVFTGRRFDANEAKELGLISKIFENRQALIDGSLEVAKLIASKSPVAVQGSKINLNYSREHNIYDGLQFMRYWNMTMVQSEDLLRAGTAVITRSEKPPTFSKL